MNERAPEVRGTCANYALPALPTSPALPTTSNSPTTPTSSTSTRQPRPDVDEQPIDPNRAAQPIADDGQSATRVTVAFFDLAATRIELTMRHVEPGESVRPVTPAATRAEASRAQRFDQCDGTCTVDCGHCKGAGRPAEASS